MNAERGDAIRKSRQRGEDIKYLVEERMEGIGVHCTIVSTCVEMTITLRMR